MIKTSTEMALVALVFLAGAVLPLQALVNARLGAGLGSPLWSAAAQNIIGVAVILLLIVVFRPPTPGFAAIAGVPAWAWIGGVLGAFYVFSVLYAAPQLGAARMMVCVIAGQMIFSVLLDHFGVLHERQPINLSTVAGVVLLLAGAGLVLNRG